MFGVWCPGEGGDGGIGGVGTGGVGGGVGTGGVGTGVGTGGTGDGGEPQSPSKMQDVVQSLLQTPPMWPLG